MTALLLLAPGTPMLFQGQEFAASSPFLYFADHDAGAGRGWCAAGRLEFLSQFPQPGHARDAGAARPTRRPARRSSAASST